MCAVSLLSKDVSELTFKNWIINILFINVYFLEIILSNIVLRSYNNFLVMIFGFTNVILKVFERSWMPDKIIMVSNSDYIHANDQFSINTFLWYWVCVYMISIVCVTIFNHEITRANFKTGVTRKTNISFPLIRTRAYLRVALLPYCRQVLVVRGVLITLLNIYGRIILDAWWILAKTWNSIAITFINTSNTFRTFWLLKSE